ncbi:hypothetical protein LCGC14_1405760 [marine sediment metagenome]|uniref:Uncharacterized protein n=1 Tax=marine sediment metagenome TaxID=412755 RepID=A0A0F9KGP0_9ZZZZ
MPDKPLTASKWEMLKAKVFGRKIYSIEQPTKTEKGCEVIGFMGRCT